ncbi:hypothetical protein Tco_0078912 [Tanacetum coccineum]
MSSSSRHDNIAFKGKGLIHNGISLDFNSFFNRIHERYLTYATDQICLDDALVAPANRLKIGKCNLRYIGRGARTYNHYALSTHGKTSYGSLRLSQAQILWGMYNNKKVDYAYLLWSNQLPNENKKTKKGQCDKQFKWHYAEKTQCSRNQCHHKNEYNSVYRTILPAELTNEDIRNSKSYKEYYAIASGKIPPKTKASKKKADSDATTKQKPPTVPKEKKGNKTGKGKQKAKELETISEAILT